MEPEFRPRNGLHKPLFDFHTSPFEFRKELVVTDISGLAGDRFEETLGQQSALGLWKSQCGIVQGLSFRSHVRIVAAGIRRCKGMFA